MGMCFLNRFISIVGTTICVANLIQAQSPAPTSIETSSGVYAVPVSTGVLSQKDPAALAELTSHFAAIGSVPWIGMQGMGTIAYGLNSATSYDATMSALGAQKYRLDAQTPKGQTSTRIERLLGKIQSEAGSIATLTAQTAAGGIFPFELARSAGKLGPTSSLRDQGLTTVGGLQLHRITLERATVGKNPTTNLRNTEAIDLYFDPSTHLLVKSSVLVPLAANRSASVLSVVSYSDYRLVGTTLVPFCFTETIQGEQSRILQLKSVSLNPTFDSGYFTF
jgi:hypothetical protein